MNPSDRDGVKAAYLQLRGEVYKGDKRDHQAWTDLKAVASIADIEARWRVALDASGYLKCNTIWELGRKWNDLAAKMPRAAADLALPDCEACGVAGRTSMRVYRHWLCAPCSDLADEVAAKVPAPSPRITRLGDPRIGECQLARDLAVSLWAAKAGAR
jgi:hypothetical protein